MTSLWSTTRDTREAKGFASLNVFLLSSISPQEAELGEHQLPHCASICPTYGVWFIAAQLVHLVSMARAGQTCRSRIPARVADLYAADCSSYEVLDHIATRWGSLILVMLLEKTHRFSELARGIGGVSERMLAHSLHAPEADGFVLRVLFPDEAAKRSSTVSPPLGLDLAPMFGHLLNGWNQRLTSH